MTALRPSEPQHRACNRETENPVRDVQRCVSERIVGEGNVNDRHLQANGSGERRPQPCIRERMNERTLLVGPRVEHIEHLRQHQRGKSHRLRVA